MTSLFGTFSRDELRHREGNSRVLDKQKERDKQPDKVALVMPSSLGPLAQ